MIDPFVNYIVASFVELVPILLKLPGVKSVLSGKLNQDPIEKFFGCIRQSGRVNDNPTVAEALKSTQNAIRFSAITGNCRGTEKRKAVELEDIDKKLPKRKRRKST